MQRDAGRKSKETLEEGHHANEAREAAKEIQNRLMTEALRSLFLGFMEIKSILPAARGNKRRPAILLSVCTQDKKLHNSCIDHTPPWLPKTEELTHVAVGSWC